MQYYVVSADGQKYGPADVATLAQWAQEGRLTSDTLLESMQDASRVPASQVPGVFTAAQGSMYAEPGPGTTYSAPPQFSTYPRGGYQGGDLPMEYATKFNWGAFYFSWIWGLNHKAYLTLLILPISCVPYLGGLVNIGLAIWFGTQGNRWAWQSGRWTSPDEMMACQKIWATWALWMFLLAIALAVIAVIFMSMAPSSAGGFR